MIEYTNEDCMVGMARYPDKYFDLAIVDPPYGLNIAKEKPRISGRWNYIPKQWDSSVPDESYFTELVRVSKNQIIWGGNYFALPPSRCWVLWDKQQPVDNFADGEMAWTSFDAVLSIFRFSFCLNRDKIHPTPKPVALYKWLLTNYAKPGDKILDTHVGSASSLIACHDMGFDAVGFELDPDYYKASKQRLEDFMAQPRLEEACNKELEQIQLMEVE